jgi:ribose 1,5-bisphosphokinase PhnN
MKVLVIIGPSASGKSTVARELHRRGIIFLTPSWTTRPRRIDEEDEPIEHRFVDEEEFRRLEDGGFFLGVARPFGLPYRYGLPPVQPSPKDKVPAIMGRASLLGLAVEHFPSRVVYQIEAAPELARARMGGRSRIETDDGTRLEGWLQERDLGRRMASRVFETKAEPEEVFEAVHRAIKTDF